MLDWFRPHADPIPIAIAMWSLPKFCAGPGAIDDEASAMIASSFMAPVVKVVPADLHPRPRIRSSPPHRSSFSYVAFINSSSCSSLIKPRRVRTRWQ
jgi:hypothetical protein